MARQTRSNAHAATQTPGRSVAAFRQSRRYRPRGWRSYPGRGWRRNGIWRRGTADFAQGASGTDFGGGVALLVRRELFVELGGFDQAYDPAYFEDVDFGLRLRAAGWTIVYEPSAVVVHHHSTSTREDLSGGSSRSNGPRRSFPSIGGHFSRTPRGWTTHQTCSTPRPPRLWIASTELIRAGSRKQRRRGARREATAGVPRLDQESAQPRVGETRRGQGWCSKPSMPPTPRHGRCWRLSTSLTRRRAGSWRSC